MEIDCFLHADSEVFLRMAAGEGWICDRWELDFLLGAFPAGCLVWRRHGEPSGFVTSIKYDSSGWIGNLIVAPELRGNGIGSLLMRKALAALETAGVKTVWLTASAEGQHIYEKLGFHAVDTIFRWRGSGTVGHSSLYTHDPAILNNIDKAGWGDVRKPALKMLADKGSVFMEKDGFFIRHAYADGVQIGPGGSTSPGTAGRLLESALNEPGERHSMFLDVPGRNRAATVLLKANGFKIAGSTLLMYHGRKPAYRPALIYALASMGSFG